ncbi:hypothetical protein [uncultured Megasphaera sp.]|uniref:hypothetical protein n=1 Tax=uncultured Megasphaera sp. TaxID=165188 RepID=UPI0025FBED6F|nr:hypothetical protein [uncultured Megasphaera sp.]
MNKHHQGLSFLDFILYGIEIISSLCISVLILIIAVPFMVFAVYLFCLLAFPAAWVIPLTAGLLVFILLIMVISIWSEWRDP